MGIDRVVTEEMVFAAADQLAAAGVKVTNRAIWSAVGGGSMTTISQALRRWKERQDLQPSQPIERAPLPAAVIDVLHQAAAHLWDAALAETKDELEQLAQATNARVSEAQNERDETLAELQATAEELEQVKQEREAVQAAGDTISQQLAAANAEIARLQAELAAQTLAATNANHRAETAAAAREELHARVSQLSQLLTDEQTARKHAEAEANRLRAELAKLSAEHAASVNRAAEQENLAAARYQSYTDEITALKGERQEQQALLLALTARLGDSAANPPPVAEEVDVDALAWLVGASREDINFKNALENANAATLHAALNNDSLVKTKRAAVMARLKKL